MHWLAYSVLTSLRASACRGLLPASFCVWVDNFSSGFWFLCRMCAACYKVLSLSHPCRFWCEFCYLPGWYRYMRRIITWCYGAKCFMWWSPRLTFTGLQYICKLPWSVTPWGQYNLISIDLDRFYSFFCWIISQLWSFQLVLGLGVWGVLSRWGTFRSVQTTVCWHRWLQLMPQPLNSWHFWVFLWCMWIYHVFSLRGKWFFWEEEVSSDADVWFGCWYIWSISVYVEYHSALLV